MIFKCTVYDRPIVEIEPKWYAVDVAIMSGVFDSVEDAFAFGARFNGHRFDVVDENGCQWGCRILARGADVVKAEFFKMENEG